jgi:hypothetical protein
MRSPTPMWTMGAPVVATAESAPPPRAVERGRNRAGGLANLGVNDQPAVGGTRESSDVLQLFNEFFIELMSPGGVHDHEVCGCAGSQAVSNDGDGVFGFGFAVNLDRCFFKEL